VCYAEECVTITLKQRVTEAQGGNVAPGHCAKISPGTRLNCILRDDQRAGNRSTLPLKQLPGWEALLLATRQTGQKNDATKKNPMELNQCKPSPTAFCWNICKV